MLRRLVRSYFKLRYFPRVSVEMLTDVLSSQTRIARSQEETASSQAGIAVLLTALREDMAGLQRSVAGLQQQRRESHLRSASSLDNIHAEITSFCDDATKAMMASKASQLDTRAEVENLRLVLQQLESKVAVVLAEMGSMQAGIGNMQTGIGNVRAGMGNMQTELAEAVQRQAGELARIDRITAQQVRLFPSVLWTPETATQIRSTLALLEPMGVQGVGKVRVGRDHDGGYVMLDDFAGITTALSLGIADDVSWDEDVAAHGIELLQFDPSIDGPPVVNEHFHFEPLRIDPYDHPNAISIDTIVSSRISDATAPLLLKIDIEGGEWEVFQAISEPVLRRFRQIVCEFHDLDRLNEVEFGNRARAVFAKLATTHAVIHVHGNNCGNFTNVGNVVVPQSLEVSFALRDAYTLTEAMMNFPTPLDCPNQPGRADLYLGPFRFGAQSSREQSTPEQGTLLQRA
jgi:hypothetical protein